MNEDDMSDIITEWVIRIIKIIFVFSSICIGIKIYNNYNENKVKQKTDTLIIDNNNIKKEINELETKKHEDIIKVKELDNDSTLKLFYYLLGR